MIILITGGTRSGKSTYAQQLALSMSRNPVYVATARDWGGDFSERIKHHISERGNEWVTYEEQKHVSKLPVCGSTAVIDCVTLWLTNFFVEFNYNVEQSLTVFKEEIDALYAMNGTFIIVSNEIGMGVHATTKAGRLFTDLQGWANQYIAQRAGQVILMVSGIAVPVKNIS